MAVEIKNLEMNSTFVRKPRSSTKKPIKCRMVFDLKWDKMTGLLDKAKARLVAKGFSQIPGVDFTETYASTPKLSTMRLFLTHVISAGMSTAEWDVTAAYLGSTT